MQGPVIVGGVGGSGTRVVARILQSLGVYIGSNLNDSLDNLWLTLLMKRPDLKGRNVSEPLSVFEMAMTTGLYGVTTPNEDRIIADAFEVHLGDITYSQVVSLRDSEGSDAEWWGFKEPCASFWVDELARHFPGARFVHCIRNGWDMAMSDTMKREFWHWGYHYGEPSRVPDDKTLRRFWMKANREAITTGKSLLGDRFLVFRFEGLCRNPSLYIETLANALEISVPHERIMELCEPIHVPDTIGRWRTAANA